MPAKKKARIRVPRKVRELQKNKASFQRECDNLLSLLSGKAYDRMLAIKSVANHLRLPETVLDYSDTALAYAAMEAICRRTTTTISSWEVYAAAGKTPIYKATVGHIAGGADMYGIKPRVDVTESSHDMCAAVTLAYIGLAKRLGKFV